MSKLNTIAQRRVGKWKKEASQAAKRFRAREAAKLSTIVVTDDETYDEEQKRLNREEDRQKREVKNKSLRSRQLKKQRVERNIVKAQRLLLLRAAKAGTAAHDAVFLKIDVWVGKDGSLKFEGKRQ